MTWWFSTRKVMYHLETGQNPDWNEFSRVQIELKQFGQQTKAIETGFPMDFHDVFNALRGTSFFTTGTVWFLSFRGLE